MQYEPAGQRQPRPGTCLSPLCRFGRKHRHSLLGGSAHGRCGPTQHSDLDPSAINVEPNGHNSPTHHRNQIQLRIVSGYLPGMARYRMRLLVPHVQLAIPAATREQALFKQTPFDADDELSVVIKLSL
eukprot:CAMPEP_0181251590 /NCGR_PEP_ID=MMETSP1096-20121128/46971_1 /TAXON_ID=156174 ORGANISM="Chrysochromulina ericina, Strain CCMP281" /NCGR_SAMPLE_ID=MMETSP1096 /ASSEMBLY_ACC=CAM_ASM_000453 /LENGTH=127 /DNA_ID=CAMNT_0023349209 /DNA_START=282 /DNA_END=665 /DNA_ORIENTATION=-